MDPLVQFLIEREPLNLVGVAIYETAKQFNYPIESREQFRQQLFGSVLPPRERAAGRQLLADLLPASIFPLTCVQNALEKLSEAIIQPDVSPSLGLSTEARFTPGGPDPARCRQECMKIHRAAMMELMESGLHGTELLTATLKEVKNLNECLKKCDAAIEPHPER